MLTLPIGCAIIAVIAVCAGGATWALLTLYNKQNRIHPDPESGLGPGPVCESRMANDPNENKFGSICSCSMVVMMVAILFLAGFGIIR